MAYITPYQYYTNNNTVPTDVNWGSYQYVSLSNIVTNFKNHYTGNDKQLNNVPRADIIFHAKQGIKELNFDALNAVKTVEMEVGDNLKFILPSDYVNWIRISININGQLRPLNENRRANTALGYLQDNDGDLLFDVNGEVLIGDSDLDIKRLTQSTYTGAGPYCGCLGWETENGWFFGYSVGKRYGIDPSEAVSGPTFRVNNGVIDFSSGIAGHLVVLEYISDGMEGGDDSLIAVNKFAEEFVYRHIKWALLNQKYGITIYDRNQAKNERKAMLNNTKIRLKNLHPSSLLMSLRGQGKQIK